ncbi:programmed cell death protein 2 [Apodospora peruviana]|uniref:Programmed cell death protein 2 n=1 Tax=Apodospora peruviana TaxID=516989 RepID=A0AAE0HUL2_9PEZI|nr:programmed cell death protein 2 [Apodospora peruviana]
MAPYDSDSSEGEDDNFTETNVLLGYAGSDANGEQISRLGGRPDWLIPAKAPSAALARCKVCKDPMVLLLQLNGELPDRFPGHERRIYVFSCRRKSCRRREGSIRAIRGLRVSQDAPTTVTEKRAEAAAAAKEKVALEPPKAAMHGLGEALFGVKPAAAAAGRVNPFATTTSSAQSPANPFAPKASAGAAVNPFSKPAAAAEKVEEPAAAAAVPPVQDTTTTQDLPKTFAEKLSLNNPQQQHQVGPVTPPEPWPEEDAPNQPSPFPVRWLSDAEYETIDPTPPKFDNVVTTPMEIDSSEGAGGSGNGGGKEDKEVFESSMDGTFQKFADRVGQNPDQCIRYEFAGQPLLYSKSDAVGALLFIAATDDNVKVKTNSKGGGIPRCQNCGAARVFEVQLTPHAIEELEIDEDGLDGMDWGTVIVGVCEKDCQERGVPVGEAGYLEEWAGVQWEELTAKR